MTDRAAINRRLAEWLGIKPEISWHALNADESATCMSFESKAEGQYWLDLKQVQFPDYYGQYHIGHWESYPDFFADESASALLLEKMPMPCVFRCAPKGEWACRWNAVSADPYAICTDPDRKTCIALAADKIAGGKS